MRQPHISGEIVFGGKSPEGIGALCVVRESTHPDAEIVREVIGAAIVGILWPTSSVVVGRRRAEIRAD